MRVRVTVMYKKGVLDPQGKTILGSLHQLGYKEVTDVKAGKVLEISLPKMSKAQLEKKVKEMCDKLLANPIIEDYQLEVTE
ncbi:MAG TPA: phosphoribosylformylglycinamidine synthase subunit PurS [Candidatus Polarisedimenticolia bacterium]|jgi:phosphoribosylformylglycinamidine synthase|nr:phosphoribosylformylglycinamidine synthase subunit PurS [Candidatus Polarisedimenticolia bacterium]